MRHLFLLLVSVLLSINLGCGKKAPESQSVQEENTKGKGTEMETLRPLSTSEIDTLIAKVKAAPLVDVEAGEVGVIETDLGRIVIEFYPEVAPAHCRAFKRLASTGFYDGTNFHRVVPDFVIQGGDILSRDADPSNDGTGQPGYTLPAEFSTMKHERGILSMAKRAGDNNSAGSQFFICLAPIPHLDGQFTIFGRVIEGLEVVDQIVATSGTTAQKQNPDNPVVMKKVRVIKRHAP